MAPASTVERCPFFFSIPLRARRDEGQWQIVTGLLRETLGSIFAQDDPDFEVVIAGHDRPDLPELADSRVTFLSVDLGRPEGLQAGQLDQIFKRRIAAAEIRRRGGGYIFVVDADDLVDHAIVSFVRADRHPVGYMVRAGYVLDTAGQRLGLLPDRKRVQQLWMNCGTCAILHFTADELPVMAADSVNTVRSNCLYESLVGHRLWETALMLHGRYPATLPFRGVIYRMTAGEHFSLESRKPKQLEELLRATIESPVDMAVKQARFDGTATAG